MGLKPPACWDRQARALVFSLCRLLDINRDGACSGDREGDIGMTGLWQNWSARVEDDLRIYCKNASGWLLRVPYAEWPTPSRQDPRYPFMRVTRL